MHFVPISRLNSILFCFEDLSKCHHKRTEIRNTKYISYSCILNKYHYYYPCIVEKFCLTAIKRHVPFGFIFQAAAYMFIAYEVAYVNPFCTARKLFVNLQTPFSGSTKNSYGNLMNSFSSFDCIK